MNYVKIDKCDIANGLGVGVVLWVSGCSLRCPGCHNPQTWSMSAGQKYTNEAKIELLEACSKPYISRLTLSGGHPLESENILDVYDTAEAFKRTFPEKKLWLYTGFEWEDIVKYEVYKLIINLCDVIVDGPYIDARRNVALPFRGSNNQRVINVKKTLETGTVTLMFE